MLRRKKIASMRRKGSTTSLSSDFFPPIPVKSRSSSLFLAFLGPKDDSVIFEALNYFQHNLIAFVNPSNRVAEVPPARLLVSPDSRSRNVGDKLDAVVEYVSNLTLFLKKSRGDNGDGPYSAPKKKNRVHQCSYCNVVGHKVMTLQKSPTP